jgi:hypothetical protein
MCARKDAYWVSVHRLPPFAASVQPLRLRIPSPTLVQPCPCGIREWQNPGNTGRRDHIHCIFQVLLRVADDIPWS